MYRNEIMRVDCDNTKTIGARTTVLMVEFHLLLSSPDPLGCLCIPWTSLDQLYTKTAMPTSQCDTVSVFVNILIL